VKLACAFAWLLICADGIAADDFPVLALAREMSTNDALAPSFDTRELRHAEHTLEQARPPADEDCAHSLGASTYAQLHLNVATALQARGESNGAAASYRRALACRPRSVSILRQLAELLLDSRDYDGARAAVDQALAIEPRAVELHRLAGYLDFLAERWTDAMARFRYVASGEPDRDLAGYGQLMYWLSQARAGVPQPQFVARKAGDRWPQPLLLYMKGAYTEAELAYSIRQGDEDFDEEMGFYASTDERLAAALFYVGQSYWVRGKPEVARDYFAALVTLRLPASTEHGLALSEIAKLNRR
jgi:tetratricopeptide (TPR) repeat protein